MTEAALSRPYGGSWGAEPDPSDDFDWFGWGLGGGGGENVSLGTMLP